MLYHLYEFGHAAVKPARVAADSCRLMFNNPFNPLTHTMVGRHTVAACEVFERSTRRYGRPGFNIASTVVDGEAVPVHEIPVWHRPFCRLLRFVRGVDPQRAARDPRVLIVAPMSGHYATLLRGTVQALLPDHEVFITDWQDARLVPRAVGDFDLDDYISYLQDMLRHLGGEVHVLAVCQPSVPVLAAVALMEEEQDPSVPLSVVLAGGPVDTRINPTVVNRLAEERGIGWFRRNVVTTVPWPNAGAGRAVYPGFLQLTGFMTMNLDRHVNAHKDLFRHLVQGDGDSAEKHREFYDEYLAVMDLTAEFFLQTIETVFVRHALPKGEMRHRGRTVDLGAIRRVALMTIEGEKDDITGVGQCEAALALCKNIPAARKTGYVCPGVGHYGIFNGSKFKAAIVPRMARFFREADPKMKGEVRLPEIDQVEAQARATGQLNDPAALAFTFAAANDQAPDPVALRLKGRGLGAQDAALEPTVANLPRPSAPQTPLFQLWALLGEMFIETLMRPPLLNLGRWPMR